MKSIGAFTKVAMHLIHLWRQRASFSGRIELHPATRTGDRHEEGVHRAARASAADCFAKSDVGANFWLSFANAGFDTPILPAALMPTRRRD